MARQLFYLGCRILTIPPKIDIHSDLLADGVPIIIICMPACQVMLRVGAIVERS